MLMNDETEHLYYSLVFLYFTITHGCDEFL